MSPTLELQGAIVPRLKAHAALAAIVGGRVYDHVPRSSAGEVTGQFPFVALGHWAEAPDDADCIEGAEIFGRVECWSRGVGKPEALRMAEAVRAALHNAEIDLTANALVDLEWVRTDTIRDPDGLTHFAVVEIRALVERP